MQTIISGVLAGISISLGGTVYLLIDSKIVGALFFTVGLFCVCVFGFSLFTGKVCYVFDNDRKYSMRLPMIWFGNLIGAILTGFLFLQTRLGPALIEKASAICKTKLNQGYLSAFILAINGSGRARSNAYIKETGMVDVGADIFRRGLCLPSDNKMTEEQQDRVIEIIHRCFR